MMRQSVFLSLIMLSLILTACNKPGCLGEAGPMVTAERKLDAFNELLLNDNINVVLTQDTVEKMIIEAPQHIVPEITSTIAQNKLTISNQSSCRWVRKASEKINVHLFLKDLKKITYQGSGDITNTGTLKLDGLYIESYTGAGNITLTLNNRYTGAYIFNENAGIDLHGKSDICYTYTNARGQLDLGDFAVRKMVIEYGGLADTHVNVSDELDAIIYFKGNIYYRGSPVITRSVYHSDGRLVPYR